MIYIKQQENAHAQACKQAAKSKIEKSASKDIEKMKKLSSLQRRYCSMRKLIW